MALIYLKLDHSHICSKLVPIHFNMRAQLWAKVMGQSVVLLGTSWETHWELGENVKNTLGTW